MKVLVFDTETTGLGRKARLVQLAWQLYDGTELIKEQSFIIKPYKFEIPEFATKIHGITTEYARKYGKNLPWVLRRFIYDFRQADLLVGHNIDYDIDILRNEVARLRKKFNFNVCFNLKPKICTMQASVDYLKLPNFSSKGTTYKYPKLVELYKFLFNKDLQNAHNALYDVRATAESFFELVRRGVIKVHLK